MSPIPLTIINGFLGSGKTTLILNLIPQLPKDYRLALLKNEFGDVAIDSQLASSSAISGVKELLNGCICCNLVGQLGDALETLRNDVQPDRIIIETSGSAFPATLAMEVNRLGRESGKYALDGVIVVIDVENWKGYQDTSYTAKMQARYTDLIVFNKWELVDERRYEHCLDRVGDLELQVANVKSDKGWVEKSVLLGLDNALAKDVGALTNEHHGHENDHAHATDHQSEVEVLAVTLLSQDNESHGVSLEALGKFLHAAPKDEIYRIKAIIRASRPPVSSGQDAELAMIPQGQGTANYILNWAFGRWTFTRMNASLPANDSDSSTASRSEITKEATDNIDDEPLVRMTVILARYEAEKWKTRIHTQRFITPENGDGEDLLQVKRIL